ncbi:hypothetical protein ASD23_14100 [Agromyces sp. Root1464]|uniref:hypothetical protein n=1 Tax=Agromyces sp. Root1464 TaxID=1736467 RepID=UPI0006F68A49|nr:hypothetical protein [Agromyces sp. Root1464]KQZ09380.1 hypothetical protein ASD23_14100 [Agromyces sp. Root1464]
MRLITGGIAAAALVLLLTGCVAPAPAPTQTPVAEPTPVETAPAGPLMCGDLVADAKLAAVMTGSDGVAPDPVRAIRPSDAFSAVELAAAGGLGCSWRVGAAPTTIYAGGDDLAYLSIDVLPGAAAQWQPAWAGDAPSDQKLAVGAIEASTAVGESGWQLTAPVGDAWVAMRLTASGLGTTGSRYDGISPEEMLSRLAGVAETTFAAVEGATAEQLAFPAAASQRQGDAVCNGGLDPQGIGMALGTTYTETEVEDPTTRAPQSFDAAVAAAARSYSCDYLNDTERGPHIAVVHGAGQFFDLLGQADVSTAFGPLDLSTVAGASGGDAAIVALVTDGPASPVLMRVGDSVYLIQSKDGAASVAEAVIAQVR